MYNYQAAEPKLLLLIRLRQKKLQMDQTVLWVNNTML